MPPRRHHNQSCSNMTFVLFQAEGFFEFKMRKLHQKLNQSKDGNNQGKEDSFDTSGEIQSKFFWAAVVVLVSQT